MGLLSDLAAPVRQYPCAVRRLAETLDKEDAQILYDAVMNKAWAYYTLETALAQKGLTLGQSSIKKHRLKNCSCWRSVNA